MIKVLSIHVDDVVLLYLAGYLAKIFRLFSKPSKRRLYKKVIEEALQRLSLLVVVAFVDTGDSNLLVLPHRLLILLLLHGHIYQLLLDLGEDLNADA